MDKADKVIIMAWLLSKESDVQAASDFVIALDQGVRLGEDDAIQMHKSVLARIEHEDVPGEYGDFIRVIKASGNLMAASEKLEKAVNGFKKAQQILKAEPKNDLAAKILIHQAMKAVTEGLERA
ncbi:hypothetical protein [Roseibium sp. RKSG952]|uniref:hypothetical protein n=1 Tax=Roseibium sp. RKSG952 TaxID=2529384 RepID=UPI0012BBF909|nr:hypothetical protein [Roseibium sp. RKSG952]MTH95214.1 hypothetical protein [Roseibium sp. RKSG952]